MTPDILVRGATVMPGDGPGSVMDVGIVDGRIAAVAPSLPVEGAGQVVEAEGLILCPGFIDMHAHSALASFQDPLLGPKIAQGFTTELIHPDGLSPVPADPGRIDERRAYLRALEGTGPEGWAWSGPEEYLGALAASRPATSLVPSVGHNAVRDYVMGSGRRPATAEELGGMRDEVRRGFEAGARALSFGLIYLPGMYADTAELIELAREAARFGAPLVPHVRNEAEKVVEAVGEMVEVARTSGASLHLSHLKVVGNAGLVDRLLELIDRASTDLDISFDQYPYGAGSTMLSALLPPWAQDGGLVALLARLEDLAQREAMRRDALTGLDGWENLYRACGPEGVVIADAGAPRQADTGKTLAEVGAERGEDPYRAALDLLYETRLAVTMVDHYATEETVRAIFRHPLGLVGSDGIFGARPHPRLYGTAARVLGRYALREGLVPVEEAVARLTARAADRLRLTDRGRVRQGLRADLVLIDPAAFVDRATYEDPCREPEGMITVWVAGEPVWEGGRATGRRPGGVVAEALTPA